MKKSLLLCVVLMASSFAMAQRLINSYDFSTCSVVPTGRYQGANVPAASFSQFNGTVEFAKNDGLVVASGGQWANEAQPYYDNLVSGWSFVNLGGEVGRCLCLYGPKSTDEDILEFDFNTTYGSKIPMSKGGINWGNLNFYSDPEGTPAGKKTLEGTHVRVEIIMSIYSQTGQAQNYFNTIYAVDDQNNVHPTQGVANLAPGTAICVDEFFDPETFEWKSDQWLRYSFDTFCPEADEKASYAPLHLKMEMNGGAWAGNVCFIKSISFYEVDDIEMDADKGRLRTWLTLTPDLDNITVDNGSENAIASVLSKGASSKVYDLSGREVSGAAKGLYIQNGKKIVK